jgi:putative ABC transport system permease protein
MRYSSRTLAVILPLATFVMVATAVFAILDETLLRPVPGTSGDAFVSLRFTTPTGGGGGFGSYDSLPAYRRAGAPAGLLALGASCCHDLIAMTAPGSSTPSLVVGNFVTGGYFAALGVRTLRGRLLTDDEADHGAERVAVVSELLWRRAFGADAEFVGRTLTFNGVSFNVIGITAAFQGWSWNGGSDGRVDVWLPLTSQPQVTGSDSSMSVAVGRLRRPNDIAGVEAQIRATQVQIRDTLSGRARLFDPFLEEGLWPLNVNRSATSTIVTLLTWFVAMVGALACANAASSIVTQIAKRRREIAVRLAMGASRWQVARPLLMEALRLSAAITIVGALASALLLTQLKDLRLSSRLPVLDALAIDWRVLAFSGVAALLTVTLATILPLAATLRSDIRRDLWDPSRATGRRRWPHAALLAVQLAASVALLAAALTIGISLHGLVNAELGIEPSSVVEIAVQPSPFGYTQDRSSTIVGRFVDELRRGRFTEVATSSPAPLEGMLSRMFLRSETMPTGQPMGVADVSIGGNYFTVLKLNLLAGRGLSDQDETRDGVAPVVISDSMASTLFGNARPVVGRGFEFDRSGGTTSWQRAVVVGVAADVKANARSISYPAIYHRLPASLAGATILVRFNGPASKALSDIEDSARRADPVAALFDIRLLTDKLTRRLGEERTLAAVTRVTAPIALIIAFAGIATIAAQLMRERRREFAIRSALGASPAALSSLVVRSLVLPTSVGTIGGLAVYAWCSGLLRSYVFGVGTLQTSVLIAAAGIVASVALLAALLRASIASRREPVEGLRLE